MTRLPKQLTCQYSHYSIFRLRFLETFTLTKLLRVSLDHSGRVIKNDTMLTRLSASSRSAVTRNCGSKMVPESICE